MAEQKTDTVKTKRVRCVVVTPETTVLEADAAHVVIPAFDGEVGIYPNRSALVARLGPGALRLVDGSSSRKYYIDGGFGQVRDNVVTILTPRARAVEELDADALHRQLDAINAEVATTPETQANKSARLTRVRAQLHLATSK